MGCRKQSGANAPDQAWGCLVSTKTICTSQYLAFPVYNINMFKLCHYSPARDGSPQSSTEDSLDSKEMASMSPPPAHSASPKGDDEVASQRIFPDQGRFKKSLRWCRRMTPRLSDTWGKSPHGDWQWGPSSLRPLAGYHSGNLYGSGV